MRDLNKGDDIMVDQSYSERQLFEKAYDRIISEFQIILNLSKDDTLKKLDKASDSYVLKARELKKDYIKETKDKFSSYHSTSLLKDPDFMNFRDYVGSKAWEFLDWQGFDMSLYKI